MVKTDIRNGHMQKQLQQTMTFKYLFAVDKIKMNQNKLVFIFTECSSVYFISESHESQVRFTVDTINQETRSEQQKWNYSSFKGDNESHIAPTFKIFNFTWRCGFSESISILLWKKKTNAKISKRVNLDRFAVCREFLIAFRTDFSSFHGLSPPVKPQKPNFCLLRSFHVPFEIVSNDGFLSFIYELSFRLFLLSHNVPFQRIMFAWCNKTVIYKLAKYVKIILWFNFYFDEWKQRDVFPHFFIPFFLLYCVSVSLTLRFIYALI